LINVVTTQTDSELLRTFIKTHSEEAFEALVRRHIDMVYASAMRQIKDSSTAEDITQAVFIVLSRRAGRIGNPHLLAGWLLHVTRYCAADARKLAGRRRFHERRAALMETAMEPPELTHAEISEQLDTHLASLSALDRTAIVLRCLEERPLSEVAKELNITEEAAKKRLNRALEKLRNNFSKSAVPPSVALLTATLAKQSLAAPSTLAAAICKAAVAKTASTATAALLTKGALKLMAYTTAKVVAVAAIGTLVIAATTVGIVHITQSAPALAATEVAATVPDNAPPASSPQPAASPPFVFVMGKVSRPGVYQLKGGFNTYEQILEGRQGAHLDPGIRDTGWITLIRRVGPDSQHILAMPIADFLGGNLPAGAVDPHPNDVYNITDAPLPFGPTVITSRDGTIKITGNISKPGDYDIFGQYLSLADTLTQFAAVTPDQLPNLVVSVGQPKEDKSIQYIAQYKMADITSGKSATYHPSPGQTLLVQTLATAMSAKEIVKIVPLPTSTAPAPIPADKPPTANGTFQVTGDSVRTGSFVFNGQPITLYQAVAASAKSIDILPTIATVTLTRKMDNGPDKIITVSLKPIIDRMEPDHLLQDNDILEVHAKP
jgi:RNA polymerase sigma factor (sigma-70 family)